MRSEWEIIGTIYDNARSKVSYTKKEISKKLSIKSGFSKYKYRLVKGKSKVRCLILNLKKIFKKNLVKDTTNGKTEQEETCTNLYLLQVILSD